MFLISSLEDFVFENSISLVALVKEPWEVIFPHIIWQAIWNYELNSVYFHKN